jgi:Major Facilitator Superfamily
MKIVLSEQEFHATHNIHTKRSLHIHRHVFCTFISPIVLVLLTSEGGSAFSTSIYQRAIIGVHSQRDYRTVQANWSKCVESFDEIIPTRETSIDLSGSAVPDRKDLTSSRKRHLEQSFNATDEENERRFQNNEKNIMLALLWIIAFLSALDRVAMSVALVPMSQEFLFTDAVKGSISSLFSLGYSIGIIPAGLLVANASPTTVLAWGIAIWSLATLVTPVTSQLIVLSVSATLAPLLLARACVGAGESLVLPTTQRILTIWTTADQKGFGMCVPLLFFKNNNSLIFSLPLLLQQLHLFSAASNRAL